MPAQAFLPTQQTFAPSYRWALCIKLKITINQDSLDKEDIEILQDLIVIAANENIKSINKDTESKLGKFGGMAGLL